MIEISEQLLRLADAAELLPRRRRGKKPHPSTLFRWATRGLRGIRLEVTCVGGVACTSVAALNRFFEALARSRIGAGKATATEAPGKISDCEAELDARGY